MKRTTLCKSSGIYQLQSVRTGQIYIGSAVNIEYRVKTHLKHLKKGIHYNKIMQSHVDTHGVDDLQYIILEFCRKKKLLEREQYYLDSKNPQFNICQIANSRLGVKLDDEKKKKFQGPNNPMYGKTGIFSHRFGKKHTEAAKRKMTGPRKSLAGENNPNSGGKNSWNKGKTKYPDPRVAKISERMKGNQINKGRKLSDEEKKKRSDAMKRWYKTEAGKAWKKKHTGNPLSEETKKKISQATKGKKKPRKILKEVKLF